MEEKIIKEKFQHGTKEVCVLCKKEIQMDIDNWATIIDYKGKNQQKVRFYHASCLSDLLKANYGIMAKDFSEKVNQVTRTLLQRKGIKFN
jgi:hypothetical protein